MDFTAAIVKEEETTCVVVVVIKDVVENKYNAEEALKVFSRFFPLMTVVLMAQDHRGDGIFYGPPELVRKLSKTKVEFFPWKQYSVKD
ncbi:MAG: hypothetical protein GXY34_02000 [Syntrophomonadaceae bacterium]|nr:hypothetical protein [Syntrophomonadaceae bacterium]